MLERPSRTAQSGLPQAHALYLKVVPASVPPGCLLPRFRGCTLWILTLACCGTPGRPSRSGSVSLSPSSSAGLPAAWNETRASNAWGSVHSLRVVPPRGVSAETQSQPHHSRASLSRSLPPGWRIRALGRPVPSTAGSAGPSSGGAGGRSPALSHPRWLQAGWPMPQTLPFGRVTAHL